MEGLSLVFGGNYLSTEIFFFSSPLAPSPTYLLHLKTTIFFTNHPQENQEYYGLYLIYEQVKKNMN